MIRQRLGFFIKPHLFDQRLELEYKTLNRTKGYQFWVDSHANDFVPLLSTQFFVQSNMHNGKLILNGSRSRMNSTSNSGDSLTFSSVNQIKFCFEGSCSEPGLSVTISSRKTPRVKQKIRDELNQVRDYNSKTKRLSAKRQRLDSLNEITGLGLFVRFF